MAKTTTVATTKTVSKIEQAKVLFDRIMTAKLPEGKSHRGLFMEAAAAELGMSKAGANTYFQNLKNEADGSGRYKYAPSSTANATGAPTKTAVTHAEGDVLAQLAALTTQATQLNKSINKLTRKIAA